MNRQSGFTLVEVAIVLLIVAILLGYTVALFPQQQQLKQYRAAERDMDRAIEAIIGFAQVNGRLPCPAMPSTAGLEDSNANGCNQYGGFVPINTLGLDGRSNEDFLLVDPWGNPYRYYVSDSDTTEAGNLGVTDFTAGNEMRAVGLGDEGGDGYVDLDGRFIICDSAGTTMDDQCVDSVEIFGTYAPNGGEPRYAGAPFVLMSLGKNGIETPANGSDEEENRGVTPVNGGGGFGLGLPLGPTNRDYVIKDVGSNESTFVRRPTGLADDFDDIVRWVSPNVLFARMIQADQLP